MVGAIALAVGFLVLTLIRATEVSADTPVAVLAAGDIVLHLPVSPSVERIVADLHTELRDVSGASRDSRIAAALDRVEADEDLLRQVATTPVHMFDSGEAAATATAIYDIQLDAEKVVVTVITIELVPAYGSTAASREHENGHALINKKVARRCATEALRTGVGLGLQGQPLINSMVASISQAGSPVHEAYHRYVQNAGYGQHIRQAERALVDVPGCGT
jgi:hypothetical protein